MARKNIGVIVGSLRREAFSRRVARALIELVPAALAADVIEIGDLPLYNQDLETDDPPAAWRVFRDRVRPLQGVLFVTPEYNRSMPAVLKNAVDVGSRPPGKSTWNGKPAGIVSTSPGPIGGFGANHHLRQSLVPLGVAVMPREAYLGGVDKLFDAEGALIPATREFLGKYMHAFAEWIERNPA